MDCNYGTWHKVTYNYAKERFATTDCLPTYYKYVLLTCRYPSYYSDDEYGVEVGSLMRPPYDGFPWEMATCDDDEISEVIAWMEFPEPYTGKDNDMETIQIYADDLPIKAAEDTTTSVTTESAVEHPSHYNIGKIEVIDAINEWKLDFNLGNAVKYIARAGHKDPDKTVEDLKKAIFYIQDSIKRLEEQ